MIKPRIGFLGVGWIGRSRMAAIVEGGAVEVAAISDPSPDMIGGAHDLAPQAAVAADLDALLALNLDGLVIATPSALHAEQSIQALEHGVAVFCQKPLGRSAEEARAVVEAARRADRLLGVDFSYRFATAMVAVRDSVRSGELGEIFAADLVFHNAYGPDKPWFYDRALSGGGCVMDLGVHLVDLALWTLGFPVLTSATSRLFAGGAPLAPGSSAVEEYALATLGFDSGAAAQLACSWRLHAGQEAVISATFHGTKGGAGMRNVGGSFYDFTAEASSGTQRRTLVSPPDAWGGRAAADWATRLARGDRFDPTSDDLVSVAEVVDRIYLGR